MRDHVANTHDQPHPEPRDYPDHACPGHCGWGEAMCHCNGETAGDATPTHRYYATEETE